MSHRHCHCRGMAAQESGLSGAVLTLATETTRAHLALAIVGLVDVLQRTLVSAGGVEAKLRHHSAAVGGVVVNVRRRQPLTRDARHVPLLDVVSLHRKVRTLGSGVGCECRNQALLEKIRAAGAQGAVAHKQETQRQSNTFAFRRPDFVELLSTAMQTGALISAMHSYRHRTSSSVTTMFQSYVQMCHDV